MNNATECDQFQDKDRKYRVYIIKCTTTGCVYFNYTSSENVDFKPIFYINRIAKKDKTKYVKLFSSFKENGLKNHRHIYIDAHFVKEEAEKKVYDMHKKFLEANPQKCLNDYEPIPTEKETCELCGQTYRIALREIHQDKYCVSKVFRDELDFFEQ